MGCLIILVVAISALYQQTLGLVEWHTLSRYVPQGAQITAFSGNITIPPHASGGTPYLWPGIQASDGVFQTVLDGRGGGWWIGSGWVGGNPSYPWGGGFEAGVGQSIYFNYTSNSTGWTVTLIGPNGSNAVNFFEGMQLKTFDEVVFAIELYDTQWDFGALAFNDVTYIVSGTTETYWCTDNPNASGLTHWIYCGASSTIVSGTSNSIACNIGHIVLVDAS